MDWSFTISYTPFAPCKDVNYICLRARRRCPLLLRSSLNTFRSTCPYWTPGRLTTGCRAVRLQVCHPGTSCKLPSSSDVVSLEVAVSWSLALSHTSSEIWSGDKNLRLLCSLMADFTLSYWQATFGECRQLTVWVQTAKRLFSLWRSYSFGLRFNPALWNRAESELKWNTYITVPWEFSLYG